MLSNAGVLYSWGLSVRTWMWTRHARWMTVTSLHCRPGTVWVKIALQLRRQFYWRRMHTLWRLTSSGLSGPSSSPTCPPSSSLILYVHHFALQSFDSSSAWEAILELRSINCRKCSLDTGRWMHSGLRGWFSIYLFWKNGWAESTFVVGYMPRWFTYSQTVT